MIKIKFSSEYQSNKEIKTFVQSIPYIFENEGRILYQERNVIKTFFVEGPHKNLQQVVVKRYRRLHFIQRLIYSFFRASKASRAFNNAIEIRKRGISTPHEIACLEQSKRGILEYAYYITCYTADLPIKERLEDGLDFDKLVANGFASFVATLHKRGILHHDLNSTNVLYCFSEGRYNFSVIDINRMKFFSKGLSLQKKKCFDNLTRFTGKLDLYEYVAIHYIKYRSWNEDLITEAIKVKMKHDKAWRRRKAFLKRLQGKKTFKTI